MKFNITINQPLMIEYNLNISQWCILDVISIAPSWCEAIIKNDEVYYWVARQKIADELQALDLKADTIYRYIKQLVELDFIEHVKDGKKDLIRLSNKGKLLFSTMSEKNTNYYVGKKSEKNSEKNPTYNNTNNNTMLENEFQGIWKRYTLDFIKLKGRSGGSKAKAFVNFKKLRIKYKLEEINRLVDIHMNIKIGHKDLERLLREDLLKQYKEEETYSNSERFVEEAY